MKAVGTGSVPAKGNELLLPVSSENTSMLSGSVTQTGFQGEGASDSSPGLTASCPLAEFFSAGVFHATVHTLIGHGFDHDLKPSPILHTMLHPEADHLGF